MMTLTRLFSITSRLCMLLATACCMVACHDDDDGLAQSKATHCVYFINSLNGPGDNGYNDIIMEEEMHFLKIHPEVEAHFMNPQSLESARLYILSTIWASALSSADNGQQQLIVMNGSDYSEIAREFGDISTTGAQVLLFEDEGANLPKGVSSFSIQRYGASYVAGRMVSGAHALVLAARTGDPQLDDAVQGFLDGYGVAGAFTPVVKYLADDLSGFDDAGRAMLICDSIVEAVVPPHVHAGAVDWSFPGLCIFPLAGGSNLGVYAYVNTLSSMWSVNAIGVDKDYCDITPNIPFSLVLPITGLLQMYLEQWVEGTPWPQKASYGLKDSYRHHFELSRYSYYSILRWLSPDGTESAADDLVIADSLEKFISEAMEKEEEYVRKKQER